MHRLLQADVGAGKTAVAVYAMLVTIAAGYQAVLERWTERVVMQQYFDLIRRIAHRHGNARVLDALEEQPGESHGSTHA